MRVDDSQVVRERAGRDCRGDVLIQLRGMPDPRFIGAEAIVVEEMTQSVGLQKTLGHFRRRSADGDEPAIARAVTAARAGILRSAAVASAQAAERVIFRWQRT